jgi:hypothetical protein
MDHQNYIIANRLPALNDTGIGLEIFILPYSIMNIPKNLSQKSNRKGFNSCLKDLFTQKTSLIAISL